MKHIPNILTMLRLVLIPFIPYTYIILNQRGLSVILILIAAFSDFLDGFIARRFNIVTDLGKVLDPLADKLLLIAIILSLFYTKNFPITLLIAYLLIEVSMIIMGSLLYARPQRVVIQANIYGKVATALFFITALISVWYGFTSLVQILFVITLILKGYALSQYILHYLNLTKN